MTVTRLLILASCAGSTEAPGPPMAPQSPPPMVMRVEAPPAQPATAAPARPGSAGPGSAAPAQTGDAPEISRSVGAQGGVVVFWPRVIPRDVVPMTRDLAAALQRKIRDVVARTLPGRPIDVRPEPERVCPRAGCTAMTVGVLVHRNQNGCVALALVSGPGTAPSKIVPWGGGVRLRADSVPFREAPETQVTVTDYLTCDGLLDHEQLRERETDVAAALRSAAN